jgi:hypothetical protein
VRCLRQARAEEEAFIYYDEIARAKFGAQVGQGVRLAGAAQGRLKQRHDVAAREHQPPHGGAIFFFYAPPLRLE